MNKIKEQQSLHSTYQISLKTADGHQLHGKHYIANVKAPKATAIVVHGFTANIENEEFAALTELLMRPDVDQIVYDTRGHGSSQGQATFGLNERYDIEAAVDLAQKRDAPVFLVGVSAGAATIVNYLNRDEFPSQIKGCLLASAPAEWQGKIGIPSIFMYYLTQTSNGRKRLQNRFGTRIAHPIELPSSPIDVIHNIKIPIAIVGGTEDKLFSGNAARKLYEKANSPKRLELAPGGGHGPGEILNQAIERGYVWLHRTAL